jgi:predicted branched-subunit amino acid permease
LAINPAARDWGRARILFVQLFLQLFWVVSVTAGALGGTLFPDRVVGLEFAMTALFLVLGIEAWKARRDIPTPLAAVLVAAAITWALRAVPFALLAPLRHSELIRFLGDHSLWE